MDFDTDPILNKPELRALAPEGFYYSGFWDGFYHYTKEIPERKEPTEDPKVMKIIPRTYADMRALAEDLTKENLALMAKLKVSR